MVVVPGLMLMHLRMSLGPSMEDLVHSGPSAAGAALILTTSPHNHTSGPASSKLDARLAPQIARMVVPNFRTVLGGLGEDDICCATCVCG
jgi:hypothetical protein